MESVFRRHLIPACLIAASSFATAQASRSNIGIWFKIPIQITNYANIVPSHYTVDLAVSYDMGDQPENEYLRNISLQLVVNNVTNKRPPFAYKASTFGSGGSAFWGLVDSPIQRQISLTITKTW